MKFFTLNQLPSVSPVTQFSTANPSRPYMVHEIRVKSSEPVHKPFQASPFWRNRKLAIVKGDFNFVAGLSDPHFRRNSHGKRIPAFENFCDHRYLFLKMYIHKDILFNNDGQAFFMADKRRSGGNALAVGCDTQAAAPQAAFRKNQLLLRIRTLSSRYV